MFERIRNHLLPWVLFRFFVFVAGILMVMVIISPFLDDGRRNPIRGYRWVAAFARDLAVRRTAIASSVGLAVTAWVFFRPRRESDVSAMEAPITRFPDSGGE